MEKREDGDDFFYAPGTVETRGITRELNFEAESL